MLPTTPTAEMTRSTLSVVVPPLPSSIVAVTPSAFLSSFATLAPLAGEGGDLLVLHGQDLRQHLHHRDLGAQRAEERGELDADRPRADHQQRLGDRGGRHRLEVGPDELLVGLDARQHPRARARGDDDVFGLIAARRQHALGRLALGGLDRDPAGSVDDGLAPDHRDLVLLHQEGDAGVEPSRHLARALNHRLGVVADLLRGEPVVLGVLELMEHLGRAQQRLGGDAAPVEADAAQVVALDDRRLEAELRRPDRRDVAARPGADDDDVEALLSHARPRSGADRGALVRMIRCNAPAAWPEPAP
jgi:hypothetical protein